MRSNHRQKPKLAERDMLLLSLLKEFFNELSRNTDKVWTVHGKIREQLKSSQSGSFRLMVSLISKYFQFLYCSNNKKELIEKHEKEFRVDLKKLLPNLDKKIPAELLIYPEYLVYILSQISWFCINAYVKSATPREDKKIPVPDKELLFFLKQIFLAIKNINESRKDCDDRIDKSAKLLLSGLSRISQFQDPVVTQTINQETYKLFFEGTQPALLKARELAKFEESKKEVSMDQQCLIFCLEMQELSNIINNSLEATINTEDEKTLKKLKSFDFEKMSELIQLLDIEKTGNLKESLPVNQETGINIYANLINIADYSLPDMESWLYFVMEDEDEVFKLRLKGFKFFFYSHPFVKNFLGEEKCNAILEKIYSPENVIIEYSSPPEILVPKIAEMHDKFMDEYTLFLQKKIDGSVILQSCEDLIKQIKKLPEKHTARYIFLSMAEYMNLNVKSDVPSYNSYKNSTANLLFILKDGGDAECLQHSRYIMWILVNTAKFCIKSYEYSPSNPKFLVMTNELKQAISGFIQLTNKNPDIYNKMARMLYAKLSFVKSFLAIRPKVKKEYESQFNVFLRMRSFSEEYKKAQSLFSKNGNTDEQCMLHWFDISNCEITLVNDHSIKPFADLNCNQLISFIESLNTSNIIPRRYEANKDSQVILMEMNIYTELIESTHAMIDKIETKIELDLIQFGEGINSKLCELYRLKIKLLELKSRFYTNDFVREVLTEEKCKEEIPDIENQIETAQSSLLLFKHKLTPVIDKEKNEIKRQLKKLYSGKRNDKNYLEEIFLPEYVMPVFTKFHDSGISEVYLTGGGIRDAIEKLEPNDFDIAVNGSLSEIENIFSAAGKIIYSKHPIFSIPENKDRKEIQIRPLYTLKHNDENICDVITRENGEIVYIRRTNDLFQDAENLIFTFSAIYYDPIKNVFHDPYDGLADIRNKKIRFIKDPVDTINQYKPVIFKVIRLMARYGYTLDEETREILQNHMHLLRDENVFRLYNEINKTLKEGDHHFILEKFREYKIFHYVYDFSEESSDELIEFLKCSLDNEKIKNNPILIWATILHPSLCDMLKNWEQEDFFLHYPQQFNQLCDFFGIIEDKKLLLRLIILTYHKLHRNWEGMSNYSREENYLANVLIEQYYGSRQDNSPPSAPTSQLGLFSGAERFAHNAEITIAKDPHLFSF